MPTSQYAVLANLSTYGLPAAALVGVDNALITAHLTGASDLADSYLTARYPAPFTTWGAVLTQKVCEIAAYTLMCIVGFTAKTTDQNLLARHDTAIKWLEHVRDGKIKPQGTNTTPDPDPAAQVGQHVGGTAGSIALTPSGWIISGGPSSGQRGW